MFVMVVPQHYCHDLGPARSGTPEDRDHPFPAETFQERALSLHAYPFLLSSLPSHARLGGLGDWVINSRRAIIGCSKEQPRKEGQPTVAAAQGPKDELMDQSKTKSRPTGGNLVRILDSLESNVQACQSLLWHCSICACLCMEIIHTHGGTHTE